MNTIVLIIFVGVFLLIFGIVLFSTVKSKNKTMTFMSDNPDEIKKMMEAHGFSHEVIENMTNKGPSNFTSTKTVRKVQYVNGEMVSEETETSNKEITPLTSCPNCGAKIEPGSSGTCRYCNTTFDTYQINQ